MLIFDEIWFDFRARIKRSMFGLLEGGQPFFYSTRSEGDSPIKGTFVYLSTPISAHKSVGA